MDNSLVLANVWKKRERNINVWLPLAHPQLGTWPAGQICALKGTRTSNPLVCRPTLNPLSHTSQGRKTNIHLNPTYIYPTSRNSNQLKCKREYNSSYKE